MPHEVGRHAAWDAARRARLRHDVIQRDGIRSRRPVREVEHFLRNLVTRLDRGAHPRITYQSLEVTTAGGIRDGRVVGPCEGVGVLVAHDYNAWLGARTAVDRFCAEHGLVPLPMPDKSGSAVLLKPGA